MNPWLERIRAALLGDQIAELRRENRELREHLLKLSGYLQPQIDVLAPHLPVSELKEISSTRVMPRKRSPSWPRWAHEQEARLEERKARSRVARQTPPA